MKKKKIASSRVLKIKKRKKKEATPDVIYNSSIGKTDALFVSNVSNLDTTPQVSGGVSETPPLDPDIDEALKEIDILQKIQQAKPVQQPEKQQEQPTRPFFSEKIEKKSFWRKFFKI